MVVFRDSVHGAPKFKRSDGLIAASVFREKGIRRALKRLPAKMQRKVIKAAVSQAATVLRREAKKRAPKSAKSFERGQNSKYRLVRAASGDDKRDKHVHLRDVIRKHTRRSRSGDYYAVVGPGWMEAPHDHLVHDGTRPHSLGKKHYKLTKGRKGRTKRVLTHTSKGPQHPGSRPVPYMTDAMAASASKVYSKMAAVARKKIAELRLK